MDKDTEMLTQMSNALLSLQVKFKLSRVADRADLRPQLMELMQNFAAYQTKLLKDGVITTDEDLASMREIRSEIDEAANKQSMLIAIARTVAFITARI